MSLKLWNFVAPLDFQKIISYIVLQQAGVVFVRATGILTRHIILASGHLESRGINSIFKIEFIFHEKIPEEIEAMYKSVIAEP